MKIFKLLTGLCFTFVIITMFKSIDKRHLKTDFLLSNIEALATIENIEVLEDCYQNGTTKCPAGGYTRVVFINTNHNVIKK